MLSLRAFSGLAPILALAFSLTAPPAHSAPETVRIDGSSTVYPITEAIAEEFQIDYRGQYQVTVGVSGSGGGFRRFCRGEIAITNASRPIAPDERAACEEAGIEFIELPIALDALAVVVNPANDWADRLTLAELQTIWEPAAQGQITNWNQVRPDFPDQPLHLFGPGADSGTYDYFTEAVVGEEGSSRGDFTASEDDNVLVQGVASDPGALGFFGFAYYEENRDRLKAVPIDSGDGKPVAPSIATAKDGSYQPLSRPLFIYVSSEAAANSEAVRQFVGYYLDPELAPALVEEVGYVALPPEAYQLAREHFEARETGTAFAEGTQVGTGIEELLEAERG